jgi:DNA topoisomerase-1
MQTNATLDPAIAARHAGLRYVTDREPGIRRKRTGRYFTYIGPDGQTIRDPRTRERITSLAIPPAWTDVWICPSPRGHLQATGRDAKGRKQYRYHPRWREVRDETKFDRMIAFGEALPLLRRRVADDLARPGLPREKVLATIVRLLETTLIRVGNQEYARQNHSFGLTTMRNGHVQVNGSTIAFAFRGKSGKKHRIDLRDPHLARIVKRCRDLPGYELFQYVDERGQRHPVGSADVNDYLRAITGQDFTAKDFRTWFGTVLAARALEEVGAFDSEAQAKANMVQAVAAVAERLGNTPAICRKCYVHPAVLDAYLERATIAANQSVEVCGDSSTDLQPEEEAVLELLRRRQAQQSPEPSRHAA